MKLFPTLLMAAGLCSFTATSYAAEPCPLYSGKYTSPTCSGTFTDLSDVAWGSITLNEVLEGKGYNDLGYGNFGDEFYVPPHFMPLSEIPFLVALANTYARDSHTPALDQTLTLWSSNGNFIADVALSLHPYGAYGSWTRINPQRGVDYIPEKEETFYFSISTGSNTRNGTNIADGFLYDGQTLGGGERSWDVFAGYLTPYGVFGYNNVVAMNILSGPPILPVPEPETYAMMMAGLGVLGAVARRRRKAA